MRLHRSIAEGNTVLSGIGGAGQQAGFGRDVDRLRAAEPGSSTGDRVSALLQIRPFVESKGAQQNLYLGQLDAGRGDAAYGRAASRAP